MSKTAGRISSPRFSVIVPFYNEADSITLLHKELVSVLDRAVAGEYEIVFVDDGSTDATFENASKLSPLKLIRLKENYGQTAALAAGIAHSRGEIVVTMDGDLENDPADIPLLLEKLNQGYDAVSGWRQDRWKGKIFSRRIPSQLANVFISAVTGVKLHDHGCQLKAYRRGILSGLYLFGDMHRMMAAYALGRGGRLAEVPVKFSGRRFGVSKYGLSRTLKVFLDVLAFYFFRKYRNRPMHFFGWFGFWNLAAGFSAFAVMVFLKFSRGVSFIITPLPTVAVFFVIIGVQFILLGLLAEILIRVQHESGNRLPYRIEAVLEL